MESIIDLKSKSKKYEGQKKTAEQKHSSQAQLTFWFFRVECGF